MKAATLSASPDKSLRPFLTVWFGQLISMLGTGLSSFGLVVWLLETTKAATPYALAFLTASLPAIIFAPLAGRWADRMDRRRIMILADTFDALITLAVAVLVLTASLRPWMVYILTFLSSTSQAFQEPAWSAAVPTIVPKDKLDRANGLTSLSQALSSLIPPLLAGILFGYIGLSGLIFIDFVTYFAALAGVLLVKIPRVQAVEDPRAAKAGRKTSVLEDAVFGFRYMAGIKGLLSLVAYFALVNFCLNFSTVLLGPMVLPVAGSQGLGLVQSLFGLGALLGGLSVAILGGPKKRRIPFMIGCLGISALGLIVMGLGSGLVFAGLGAFIVVFAIQVGSASSQSIFQTLIEPGAQGRTKAARSMLATSLMPLAYLSAGPLADRVFGPALSPQGALAQGPLGRLLGVGPGRGVGLMFILSGLVLLLATLGILLSPSVRNLGEPQTPCPETSEKAITEA